MKLRFSAVLLGALFVAGCNSNDNVTTADGDGVTTTDTTITTTPATATPQPIVGYVRALHAVPETGELSLVADGEKLGAVDYRDTSAFAGVRDEKVEISAFGADGKKVAGPMPLTLKQGDDVTVLVTGVPGDVVLIPWEHKDRAPVEDQAKIAFVHSAKSLPPVEILLDGQSVRRDVKFGIATDYKMVAPGQHSFAVRYDRSAAPQIIEVEKPTVITKDEQGNTLAVEKPTPSRTVIPREELVTVSAAADLEAGKVYSVTVFADTAQQVQVKVIEDESSAAPEPEGE